MKIVVAQQISEMEVSGFFALPDRPLIGMKNSRMKLWKYEAHRTVKNWPYKWTKIHFTEMIKFSLITVNYL